MKKSIDFIPQSFVVLCLMILFAMIIHGTYTFAKDEKVMDEKISKLMIEKKIVSFTRVGEIEPSNTKLSDWYKPIIIYEGKTEDNNKAYLGFDLETEKLTVLNKE